jgi:hypothetical protein
MRGAGLPGSCYDCAACGCRGQSKPLTVLPTLVDTLGPQPDGALGTAACGTPPRYPGQRRRQHLFAALPEVTANATIQPVRSTGPACWPRRAFRSGCQPDAPTSAQTRRSRALQPSRPSWTAASLPAIAAAARGWSLPSAASVFRQPGQPAHERPGLGLRVHGTGIRAGLTWARPLAAPSDRAASSTRPAPWLAPGDSGQRPSHSRPPLPRARQPPSRFPRDLATGFRGPDSSGSQPPHTPPGV